MNQIPAMKIIRIAPKTIGAHGRISGKALEALAMGAKCCGGGIESPIYVLTSIYVKFPVTAVSYIARFN